jgi:hypothetical protein
MAVGAKAQVKEHEKIVREFMFKATPEQLLEAAKRTALAANPLVAKFNASQEPELRRLVLKEMKEHADARGLILGHLTRAGLIAPPAKAPATGAEPAKAKKEKPEKAEKEKSDKEKPAKEKGAKEKGEKAEKPAS